MAVTGRNWIRNVLLYALLAGGSVLFSLPFLWMVGTSFKVDRELSNTQLSFIPQTPVPAASSPYVDTRYFKTPRAPHWPQLRPVILDTLRAMPFDWPAYRQPRPALLDVVAPGIFYRLQQVLPDDLWDAPPEQLRAEAAARITPEMVRIVLRNVDRRLVLGTVRVRSIDLQEKALTEDVPPASFYTVASPGARLEAANEEQAILHYDFTPDGQQEVVLRSTLHLPFRADRLLRVQLSLVPDDSWHEIDAVLEMNGKRYQTMYPQHTGESQAMVLTLQPFGPDDAPDSNKIKLWIPYAEVGASPDYEDGPQTAQLTLVLRESSAWNAWRLKCMRNYRKTMNYIPFWRYTATSVLLVILNILGNIISCSLAAYAFSRLHWPGRNFSFGLMLATMMIPPQVTMIPYFLIIKSLGWFNTLTPLWVMSFFGNAFNIFLLRQFMKGIPRDLEDAAKIDGCNFLQIYWHVMMPLIKPTLICIAVFTFMGVWNDFMGPLIFLADQRLYPLSLGLYALKVQQGEFGMMMAGSLLMTLPVIALFFFAQKYFIQGIALTGTKG